MYIYVRIFIIIYHYLYIHTLHWRSPSLDASHIVLMRSFTKNPATSSIQQSLWRAFLRTCSHLPSQSLTWNLKLGPWKRRFLLETIIFRFHIKLGEGRYLTEKAAMTTTSPFDRNRFLRFVRGQWMCYVVLWHRRRSFWMIKMGFHTFLCFGR